MTIMPEDPQWLDSIERICRDVLPRCSPVLAKALREIADSIHAARADRDPG